MPIIARTIIAIFALLLGTTCRNRTHIAKSIIHYTKVVILVLPRGIEPRSSVLQTGAMTTSAKAARKLVVQKYRFCNLSYI